MAMEYAVLTRPDSDAASGKLDQDTGRAGSVLVESEKSGQPRLVRLFTWLCALFAVGFLIWAADLSQTYGLSPGDGGVLRPPVERWAVAFTTALVGIAPFAGMLIYVRLYVTRLVRAQGKIDVTVLGLLAPATRRFDLTDVGAARRHDGRMQLDISVNAPWITLWIGRRPYIIPLNAGRVDRRGIAQLAVDGERVRRRAAQH
jgi:hypothetical protein